MSKGTIICLCDITGVMAEPWVEAGYRAVLVDPQHHRRKRKRSPRPGSSLRRRDNQSDERKA